MHLLLLALPAFAFPTDADWIALEHSAAPVVDDFNDHDRDGNGNPDAIDCVGDNSVSAPALYWYTDGASIWFRMRVDDTPWLVEPTLLQPVAWAFLLDTDGNLDNFEYSLSLTGASPTVYLYRNTDGDAGPDASLDSLSEVWTSGVHQVGEASSTIHTLADWFIDVELDLAELPASVAAGQTIRVAAITGDSSTPNGADADLCGTDDSVTLGALADAWADEIGVDRDADGLLDIHEADYGADVDDADTDDDGVTDGDEVYVHGSNPALCDSDGDSLSDGLETGASEPLDATDLSVTCFVPDGDAGLTTTSPTSVDTDGGTVNDDAEDRDHDGVKDTWETDPNDPTDDLDLDGDGIPDALEDICGGDDTTDRDGDGLADADELLTDSDGDGAPDFCDEDDDNDGVPTAEESTTDSDGDGTPDHLDTDSDDNGIDDGDEPPVDVDSDCDGIPDRTDTNDGDGDCADPDADGLTNADERACGSDPGNADTDGDGTLDGDESCDEDVDCDELVDILDADDLDTSACDEPGDSGGIVDTGAPTCVDGLCGGHYTGGACSSAGLPGAGLFAALAGASLAARRRRRLSRAAAVIGAAAAASSPALAADPTVNAQRLRPAFSSGSFWTVRDTSPHAPGFGAGLLFNYASQPLVYRYDDGRDPVSLLGSAASFDLGGSFATKRLGFDVSLPLHIVGGDLNEGGFAPGDLRLGVLASILDRKTGGAGFGLYGQIGLPTGDGTRFVGSGSPEAVAGLAGAYGDTWVVSANLGMAIGAPATLGDLTWGSRVQWGAGVNVPLSNTFGIVGELEGESSIANTDEMGGTPLEWRVGGSARLTRSLQLDAGFGTGLTTGIGAPEYRVIAGLRYLPAAETKVARGPDRDGDGIVDESDLCPDQAEDMNGTADEDGCPDAGLVPTRFLVTDPAGRQIAGASLELVSGPETGRWSLPSGDVTRSLPPGTYELRVRAPRFTPGSSTLTIPTDAARHEQVIQLAPAAEGGTVILSVQNEAGQPVAALVTLLGEGRKFTTGGDGIGTEPVPAGEVELSIWAEGYRPKRVKVNVERDEKENVAVVLELSRVVVLADRVDIRDKVFFDLDSSTITPISYNILDDVAAVLENNESLRLVEVQGHTDDQGAEEYNLELSQRRAEAVRKYLIGQGVDPARLVARGYGESQPMEPGTTEAAREVNRRVVFKILAGPVEGDAPRPRPGKRR